MRLLQLWRTQTSVVLPNSSAALSLRSMGLALSDMKFLPKIHCLGRRALQPSKNKSRLF